MYLKHKVAFRITQIYTLREFRKTNKINPFNVVIFGGTGDSKNIFPSQYYADNQRKCDFNIFYNGKEKINSKFIQN